MKNERENIIYMLSRINRLDFHEKNANKQSRLDRISKLEKMRVFEQFSDIQKNCN